MKDLRFWLAAHVGFVCLWLGALVTAALAAVFAFRGMKELAPVANGYRGVPADDHWQIVAGHMATPLFFLIDKIGLVLLVHSAAALVLALIRRPRSGGLWAPRLHVAAFVAAACIFGYQFAVVSPRMKTSINAYWSAARADLKDEAAAEKARFDAIHPLSSKLHGALAGALALTALLGLARVACAKTEQA